LGRALAHLLERYPWISRVAIAGGPRRIAPQIGLQGIAPDPIPENVLTPYEGKRVVYERLRVHRHERIHPDGYEGAQRRPRRGERIDVDVLRPAGDGYRFDRPLRLHAVARPTHKPCTRAQCEDVERIARDQRDDPLGRAHEENFAFAVVKEAQRHALPLSSEMPCARSSSGPRAGPRCWRFLKSPIRFPASRISSCASAPRA